MKKYLFIFLLCTGCAAGKFSFTPVYNAQVAQQSAAGMKFDSAFHEQMIASPDKQYLSFAIMYSQEGSMIDNIVLADSLRPNAAKIKFIALNLKQHFLQYEADHRTRNTLTATELREYESYMRAFWQPLVTAENSLNH